MAKFETWKGRVLKRSEGVKTVRFKLDRYNSTGKNKPGYVIKLDNYEEEEEDMF